MFFDNSINFKSVQILVLCDIRWHLLHLQEVHLRMRMLQSSRFTYTSEKWENRQTIRGKGSKLCLLKYIYWSTRPRVCWSKIANKWYLNGNALLFTKVPIRPTKIRGWCVSMSLIFFFFFVYLNVHMLCKYCCSIFLSYKLEVTLSATVSVEMWWSVICTPNW